MAVEKMVFVKVKPGFTGFHERIRNAGDVFQVPERFTKTEAFEKGTTWFEAYDPEKKKNVLLDEAEKLAARLEELKKELGLEGVKKPAEPAPGKTEETAENLVNTVAGSKQAEKEAKKAAAAEAAKEAKEMREAEVKAAEKGTQPGPLELPKI